MKQLLTLLCCITMTLSPGFTASAADDIGEHRFCRHCGMDRKMYAFSRMMLIYADGTRSGVCSIHCAVTDMGESRGTALEKILVADRVSRELIPADRAFWVMGGRKRGVMTGLPTWAFSTRSAAEAFVADNGGRPADWGEVLSSARSEHREQ